MRMLYEREVLFDRADDSWITGIGEKTKRVPEAKAVSSEQGPMSSPRARAYARHSCANRTLRSRRRRRHSPVPHWPRSKSQNGWSTRAVSQSMGPVNWPSSASNWSS